MKIDSLLPQFDKFILKEENHEKIVGGTLNGYPIQSSTGTFFQWFDESGYVVTTNMFGRCVDEDFLNCKEDIGGEA